MSLTETPPARIVCPECVAGKHTSCAHFGFDADDEETDCQCGCETSRTCPSCSDTVPPGWTLDDHLDCNHPEDFE
ncbi:hypothetical protein [uncultured Microbacterium sp.]|uniref:hypothetical protein n=1 Tax=uncultured Microbacterium sp. TaxID=191216 RepID=UPI0037490415